MNRLNIGCAESVREGYINIDLRPPEGSQGIWRCDAFNLPFKDGTINEIYSSHFLEHFILEDVYRLLGEFKRVLKLGGKLTAIIPDITKAAQGWLSEGLERKTRWWTHVIFGSHRGPGMTHLCGLDQEIMKMIFTHYDFKILRLESDVRWDFWTIIEGEKNEREDFGGPRCDRPASNNRAVYPIYSKLYMPRED